MALSSSPLIQISDKISKNFLIEIGTKPISIKMKWSKDRGMTKSLGKTPVKKSIKNDYNIISIRILN